MISGFTAKEILRLCFYKYKEKQRWLVVLLQKKY